MFLVLDVTCETPQGWDMCVYIYIYIYIVLLDLLIQIYCICICSYFFKF